jgi:hypothetical protein
MQNANEFTYSRNALITDASHPYFNETVELNHPYQIAVALAYIAQSKMPNTKLINTFTSGYNSYMTFEIPADVFEKFNYSVWSLNFNDDLDIKLSNNQYLVYSYFPDISATLENEILPDDFIIS